MNRLKEWLQSHTCYESGSCLGNLPVCLVNCCLGLPLLTGTTGTSQRTFFRNFCSASIRRSCISQSTITPRQISGRNLQNVDAACRDLRWEDSMSQFQCWTNWTSPIMDEIGYDILYFNIFQRDWVYLQPRHFLASFLPLWKPLLSSPSRPSQKANLQRTWPSLLGS